MKRYYPLTITLFIAAQLSAQQFDFTPSVTQGCTPLLVTFSNTSDPAIIDDYRYTWVVEPGKFSTEMYRVENSYLKPGVYTAQMNVFDPQTNMLVKTVSHDIQAFNDPDVQITSDKTESCVYKPFQFSITEKTSDSPIVSYMWIVSDGATYPMETPYAHYFTYAGTHNVFCAVTDANGCTNRERHTISVKTYNDAPRASFTTNVQRSCDPSLQVQFTNTSPDDPNFARFEWNFGDGSPANSTTKSPSHLYNGYGTYYATLKNTSIHDCEASASVAIQLIDYQPDFTISDASKPIDGNKACHGAITFEGSATPDYPSTISYSWTYEANASVSGRDTQYSVQELTGGMKKITLTVDNGVCKRSVTKTFEVETPLQISYTPTDEFYCKPTNVQYTATSNVPNSTFDWVINGEAKQGQTTQYYFENEGFYSDALTVTTPNGCTEHIAKPNNIELLFPRIALELLLPTSGCVPLDMDFTETVVYETERDKVVKVEWDFDFDRKTGTFTTDLVTYDPYRNDASHTYTERGVYMPVVRATTAKGCVVTLLDNDAVEIITVGNVPSGDLIFPDTVICASKDLKFNYENLNPNSPMSHFYFDTLWVNYPHYDFPEYNPYGTPGSVFLAPNSGEEMNIQLRDTIGPHYVYFMLSDHGCRSRVVQDSVVELDIPTTIHVHGPIIELSSSDKDCDDNYNYYYYLSKKMNVDYSSPNQYVDWYLQKYDRRGRLSPPWHIAHNVDEFYINFEDTVHTHFGTADGRGEYLITVVAYNGDEECYADGTKCECEDSRSISTYITDIKADFGINNPTPCLGDSAFIKVGRNAQDVEKYYTYWVRDGVQYYADTVAFRFDNKNIHYIEVVTADVYGCPAPPFRIPVKVYKPEAGFIADITSDCLPFTTVFSDTTRWDTDTTIVKREWYFGNGTPWQGADSVHTVLYENEGFVSPSLTITDILGCSDTKVERDYIKPIVPNSKFELTTPKLCLNHEAIITRDFSNPYFDNNIHKFTWDFGDGTIVTGDPASLKPEYIFAETVRHRYSQESVPGVFNISLTAYSRSPIDPNRVCEDRTSATIEVKDAAAQIKIREKEECKAPDQVLIVYIDNTWYSGKYNNYPEWYKIDNGVRTIVSNTSTPRAITFQNYGTQTIELITRSDYYGCELDTATLPIVVHGYEVEFEADKYLVCVGEDVTFTRTRTVNVDAYKSYWSFGDGVMNFTDLKQAVHAYSSLPDTENKRFRVNYIVEAPNSCKPQDIFRLIELHPVEANFLRGIDDLDSVGCAPHSVNFINTSIGVKNNTYRWKFGDGTTSTEKNPTHTFASSKEPYEVSLAIEGVACNDERTKKIYFYPKPNVQFDYNNQLCVGESTTIKARGNFETIAWEPAQDFSDPGSATTYYTPLQSGRAYAEIVSEYGCVEHDSLYVFVQQRPRYQGAPDSALLYYRTPTEIMLAARPDSKLIAGQIYNVNNTPMEGVFYEWSSADYLSCTHCISPDIHLECGTPGYPRCVDFPLDVQYTIHMYDALGCFEENARIKFLIVVETKASLPQAFTPNGDGNNDIAFVRGWGIKEFLEVKIYNRWGQLLFESNDLNHGWNGRYNGEDQPMETYSYTIRYIDTQDREQFVKGYITLIR